MVTDLLSPQLKEGRDLLFPVSTRVAAGLELIHSEALCAEQLFLCLHDI